MNYSNMTVEEVMHILPAAREYFKEKEIDCEDNIFRSVKDVIVEHGLDFKEVLRTFQSFKDINGEEKVFLEMKLTSLCDYIKRVHHTHLKYLMAQVNGNMSCILDDYASSHPELIHIEQCLEMLFLNVNAHIEKEEQELFVNMQNESKITSAIIESLLIQFAAIENLLNELREISFYYFLPCDVDEDYVLFYATIQELEETVLSHIYLERNFLFKRMNE